MIRTKNLKAIFLAGISTLLFLVSISQLAAAKIAIAQSADNSDAIAVRVIPNPNHYSIARWYASQGFQGSPQSLIVDGYEAIRDGRTVYVNAAKIDETTTPPTIYTNIYLISYNQDPAPKTVDILGQIVSHWKFNNNLVESSAPAPSCAISSVSCTKDTDCLSDQVCATSGLASSSCQLRTVKNCLVDADCPVNFFCNSVKAKIVRDIKRVGKLEELKEALFNFKKVNLHYPTLLAGTYLMNKSISVWPSWSQSFLANLAVSQNFADPINRLGACPGYDIKTCWDETAKRFVSSSTPLALPAGSYAFAYSADPNGSQYDLCAVLETREPALRYNFSPNNPASSNCVTVTGISSLGKATNTPPQLVTVSLTSEAKRDFNGFIKVIDTEDNPLVWSLNTSGVNWTSAGWSAAPVLQNTSNPNQKKVYAAFAGDPGVYNVNLTVTDGQGGVLSTSTPIKIVSPGPLIEADDEEYVLDPTVPFKYSFTFSGNNFTNPSANTPIISKISGAGSFDLFNFAGLTRTFSVIGDNKYKVDISGLIPTTYKFPQDTNFKYRLTLANRYASSTKDFFVKLVATNPILDFDCPASVRINKDYACPIGSIRQGNHSLDYLAFRLPAGLSLSAPENSYQSIKGRTNISPGTAEIMVKAINEYGASSTKSFKLKVNNYCGDGIKQTPNTEGRGGIYNDGYEDCDIASGVAFNVSSSNIDNQYGCMTDNSDTPDPILTNTYCIFKSPLAGGGYCGDGYCQAVVNNQAMENCQNCTQDCGECIATIQSDANVEQIAYFNGQRLYQTIYPTIGVATKTVLTGDNVFAFWVHNIRQYGFAYRLLVGPVAAPYDSIDTTNSSLKCAPASPSSHDFGSSSTQGYDPSGNLTSGGHNWTEAGFVEDSTFIPATVLDEDSQLKQVSIDGQDTSDPIPYVWGAKLTAPGSTAYYCRLTYNLDTMGICRPKCSGKECGSDGCGNTTGCGSCAVRYPDYEVGQTTCSASGRCVCTPNCSGKTCGSDGCGGTCGTCGARQICNASNQCVCAPSCAGKNCGSDGCGGTCGSLGGSCPSGQTCNASGQCVCVPNCTGKVCGSDGCGGTCGTCPSNQSCSANGQCACVPNCTGKDCGSDGCGGTCGTCGTREFCNATDQCTCIPNCSGKNCGPDDCGGVCGTCASNQYCNTTGQCDCIQLCGAPGEGICGWIANTGCYGGGYTCLCPSGQTCSSGRCYTCTPNCTGKCNGESNGCGGTCSGGNSGCASSTEVKSCNAVFRLITGFSGNATCAPNCTGYDTSECVINPSSSDWYQAPSEVEAHNGRTCMVKFNVDSNGAPICNNDALGSNTAWFLGKIVEAIPTYCSIPGCSGVVNPNKCRWLSGAWSYQCYISDLLP